MGKKRERKEIKEPKPKRARFEKPEECPICLEPFLEDMNPLKPCNHWIHNECVARSGKKECPICRSEIDLPENFEELYSTSAEELRRYLEPELPIPSITLIFYPGGVLISVS